MKPVCNKNDFCVRLRAFVRKVSKKPLCFRAGTGRARDGTPQALRALEDLSSLGVQGTFFVLGWVARKHPEIVGEIAKAHREIASHGMSHGLIYTQTPEASAGRGQQIAPREDSVHGVELEIVEQTTEPLHAPG